MENFDSWDLLTAIDLFDAIRTTANDSDINRPPEFRIKLHELHQKAMKLKGANDKDQLYEFYSELSELSDIASDMSEHTEKLSDTLSSMEEVVSEVLGDYEPDEY